jgi:hypothetical protein
MFGDPKVMTATFNKCIEFYELDTILTKSYALTFWADKSEQLHPMKQAAMMIPGSWDLKTDLKISTDWMAILGKPEDRHAGKGIYIERLETIEALNEHLSSGNAKIVTI